MAHAAHSTATSSLPHGVEILGTITPAFAEILTPQALEFVAELHRRFTPRRNELLSARVERQKEIAAGKLPDFLPQTKAVREDASWKVAPIPSDLQDRRVEITGPVERKMIINALNSGAKVFMADFEDSHAPTWEATIQGQINLRDAVARAIAYTSPEGKSYTLNEKTAVLIVRPRGWHLNERHVLIDGKTIPAALFDFGLYFFHNAKRLIADGTGPYFYLPKLESHLEARLWNDIFIDAQAALGLPLGTIKATVLIEVILAAFEMEEILFELKDHIVGLNCGRWDYIFSYIKKFSTYPDFVLPDRAEVKMTVPFLRAYSLLLIKTCHKRGAFAMGGMAAQIPVKNDEAANAKALALVKADKEREAGDGHDGTWVAHPALVPVAMEVFDRLMPAPNQLTRQRDDVNVTSVELIAVPEGKITEAGLRNNVSVSLQYLASWLAGNGCVPIFNLMEDAATAEIARSQLWQWTHHPKGVLDDGRKIDIALVRQLLAEEKAKIPGLNSLPPQALAKLDEAASLLDQLVSAPKFEEFLTLPAYGKLKD
ncbi:MAG: malate synthase A [Alphaproteobacteria bacterium]|nr:malate synthase A [Alphaproteobacteria bacterium]